jgi:hypothetical protein
MRLRAPFPLLVLTLISSRLLMAQPPATPPSSRGPVQTNRGTPIKDGEQCPPGMTEVRPRNC